MKNFLLLFTDPNRVGGGVLLTFLLLITLPVIFLMDAHADDQTRDVYRVNLAIQHILFRGIPSHGVKPRPRNPLADDEEKRVELAQAIVEASDRHMAPKMLMVAIALRENSFGNEKRGALGERSTFQILPKTARAIRKGSFPWSNLSEPECELDTVRGAALCAAALLRINRDRCHTLRGAVVLYVSGRTCRRDNRKLRWLAWDRLGIQRYLEARFGGGVDE